MVGALAPVWQEWTHGILNISSVESVSNHLTICPSSFLCLTSLPHFLLKELHPSSSMLKENRVHFPHLPLSDATSEGRAPWSPDLWEEEMLGTTLKLGWRRLDTHPRHHFSLSCGHWLEKAHFTGRFKCRSQVQRA